MTQKKILEITNLSKVYENKDQKNTVLDNINLTIWEKDFTVIMGNSGSGKSTLLYCISGMDEATSGSVMFLEQDILKMTENQLALLRRENMGFIFQQINLMTNLSILENVIAPGYLIKGRINIKNRGLELLKLMGIENLHNRMPHQVSGGQLQRAAIARSLINQPSLIFADEPTGSLNSRSGQEVLALLSHCNNKSQSILMVTHDVKAAIRGNRIIYINDGKIIGEKKLVPFELDENLKARETALRLWLSEMGW